MFIKNSDSVAANPLTPLNVQSYHVLDL